MKNLIIIGSGGLGRETAWTAERINAVSPEWNILGFFDDNLQVQGRVFDGYKVIGTTADAKNYSDAYFVCAIGSARIRRIVVEKIKRLADVKFATLIDPDCIHSEERVTFGEGCIICANTYITLDITIGNHVYIGGNGTVGHDSKIGDFVTLYPAVNVSGSTNIGNDCELGTGTQIIQGLSVGTGTIVGAGSVIVRNLPPDCTAVGVPARPIKMHGNKI
jgi:sugar O-acyltransferase (sialic acid O-acetyltransferase NeuD family)